MKKKPYIIDTTLRDGEQAPGVVFHLKEKLRIAELLDIACIPEIEAGTPAIGREDLIAVRTIANAGFSFKTLAWCRAMKPDIRAAISSGAQGVNISFPVSEIHMRAFSKDRNWVIQNLIDLVAYAASEFEYVTIGAQDASRADFQFLSEFIDKALYLGVRRVRIADTVGILNPITTARLFRKISKLFPDGNFEFHGHNDLGMATANTLVALSSGAAAASLTVNGLGERAGNAALEEVMMALELSSDMKHDINTSVFGELSKLVSLLSGIDLPCNKPVTGDKVLCHESGIHTNAILKNRNTYQIIKATQIGLSEKPFIFGKHTGKSALQSLLNKNNVEISCEKFEQLLLITKTVATLLKRGLSEKDVLDLACKEIGSGE